MLTDISLFLVGIVVGAMNGIAGGGMLIGFPALLAAGLSALHATATASIVILPGQMASAFGYRKYLRTVPKQYLLLLIPCAAGGAIGAYILRRTPVHQFATYVPGLILLAVGLFALQPLLHRYVRRHLSSHIKHVKPLAIIGTALFPLSIYGGYFGPGFGFVVLAFLSFTKLTDLHQINGMKNLAAVGIATMSILVLAPGSFINWHFGLVMAGGGVIGGYAGSQLAQKVSGHALRVFVIAVGLITVAYLAFRTY